MHILAVIPARAGSKGIPNKNIRMIAGHPLVYYAICNAKASAYITDVIVTTDSPEVTMIARQMGVKIRQRSADLCGDAVTLDAVVADAVQEEPERRWDYIITMQPTSPTLKPATLDRAIAYMLEQDLDTLISVVNAPHLSWSERDGKIVPNYEKRLNRQYLPPCYRETGAFVISKAGIVTPQTRIGPRIDVFELPPEEAQDVDTFDDLRSVESTLCDLRVGIYVNGSNRIGMGHVCRALELADEFFVKPDIYYDKNQTDPDVFGNTMHHLIPVNGTSDLFTRCRQQQYRIFINDILDTTTDYMDCLRSALPHAKLVNFEDDGTGACRADLVFNALYHETALPQTYTGEKYYIAGKPFLFYEPIPIRETVQRVLISFGGADPQNYTDRILRIITAPNYASYQFTVVLGRAKQNVDELMEYNRYPHITVLYDVPDMPEVMAACDAAVTSRGRTGYELAMLGIPTIAMAQNKREEKHSFVSSENGFTYLGLCPTDEVIESTLRMYLSMSCKSRCRFQKLLLSHDLRSGRKRVMELICHL